MSLPCSSCGFDNPNGLIVCPQCGVRIDRPAETGTAAKSMSSKKLVRVFATLIVPVVVVVGMWTFVRDAFREYHPVIAKQPEFSVASVSGRINSTPVTATIEGPFLIISLKELQQNRIVRFSDPEGVQDIPMIAYFTPSGKLVTSMSISENCRSRDFYLEGDDIHCASCPSHWGAASLEAFACCPKYHPDPIPSTVLGDEVRIELSAMRAWQPRS